MSTDEKLSIFSLSVGAIALAATCVKFYKERDHITAQRAVVTALSMAVTAQKLQQERRERKQVDLLLESLREQLTRIRA